MDVAGNAGHPVEMGKQGGCIPALEAAVFLLTEAPIPGPYPVAPQLGVQGSDARHRGAVCRPSITTAARPKWVLVACRVDHVGSGHKLRALYLMDRLPGCTGNPSQSLSFSSRHEPYRIWFSPVRLDVSASMRVGPSCPVYQSRSSDELRSI